MQSGYSVVNTILIGSGKKATMSKAIQLVCLGVVLLGFLHLASCSKEDEPIPLVVKAGDDLTAAPLATVTLNGSGSTGPSDMTYTWTLVSGPATTNDINLQNSSQATATFVPPVNGTYQFSLRIQSGDRFAEDQVNAVVSGSLTLSGAISSATVLKNVEVDPAKPDYVISSTVTVTANVSQVAGANGIVLQFDEGAGLVIQSGLVDLRGLKLTSTSGWKGVMITGGTIQVLNTVITKGGKSAQAGQTESAALVITGGGISEAGNILFEQSIGTYDLLATGGSLTAGLSCQFTTMKPYKIPIQLINAIHPTWPTTYDYAILTTPGAGTILGPSDGSGFSFPGSGKFYLTDDLTTNAGITFSSNTIFMKAGAGILMSGGNAFMQVNSLTTLDGLDGAPWKGIAFGASVPLSLRSLSLKHAGSDVFATGSFTSQKKAALYVQTNGNGSIRGCTIENSGGYGIVNANEPGTNMLIAENMFSNTTEAAIYGTVYDIDFMISQSAAPNTFTLPAGVPAVEVASTNPLLYQPKGQWSELGGENFYLITGNVFAIANWKLRPGVRLHFAANKSLDIQGGTFTAQGTAEQPIILEGTSATAGSWGGVMIESPYMMEFCQIKNGGQSYLFKGGVSLASEKANVVFAYTGNSTTNSFKNNTISGSGGYGILVESGAKNPDAENVASANTFSNNTQGNVVVKP